MISLGSYNVNDNMLSVEVRNNYTSRGYCTLSPWNHPRVLYSVVMINLGSNPNSSLEIVSALNSFNLGYSQYQYNQPACTPKYNPKVYLGTVQTMSNQWNYDDNSGLKDLPQNLGPDSQKSGSWPQIFFSKSVFFVVS